MFEDQKDTRFRLNLVIAQTTLVTDKDPTSGVNGQYRNRSSKTLAKPFDKRPVSVQKTAM